jgi:hypothetical protein
MMSNLKCFLLVFTSMQRTRMGVEMCWALERFSIFLPVFRSPSGSRGIGERESEAERFEVLVTELMDASGLGESLATIRLEDWRVCGKGSAADIIWTIGYLCCFHEKFLGHVRTSLQLRRFVRWTQRFPVAAAAVVVLLGCSISLLPGKPQGLVHWHWLNGMLYETRLCPLSGSKWYHETLRDSKGWLGCSSIKSLQHRLIPWNAIETRTKLN